MKKRTSYSDEFRANAVLMLEAAGYPNTKGALSRVARHLKVPARTISRWFNKESNPPPDKIVSEKKPSMVEALTELLDLHIEASKQAVQGYDDLRAIDTGIGILLDKIQLLTGQPTERTEHSIHDDRERIMARIAEESGGYVTRSAAEVVKRPIG